LGKHRNRLKACFLKRNEYQRVIQTTIFFHFSHNKIEASTGRKLLWQLAHVNFSEYFGLILWNSFLTVNTTPMKATTTKTNGKATEPSVWQITLKLSLLAGCFMATSYCFIITVKSIVSLI